MTNVVQFKVKNKLENTQNNKVNKIPVDEAYFSLAREALDALYMRYPFQKNFCPHETEKNFNQAAIWAIEFAKRGICSKSKILSAIDELVRSDLMPSLSSFIAVYWCNHESLEKQHYQSYMRYLESELGRSTQDNSGFIDYFWRHQIKR
jgi:hypothetical protein